MERLPIEITWFVGVVFFMSLVWHDIKEHKNGNRFFNSKKSLLKNSITGNFFIGLLTSLACWVTFYLSDKFGVGAVDFLKLDMNFQDGKDVYEFFFTICALPTFSVAVTFVLIFKIMIRVDIGSNTSTPDDKNIDLKNKTQSDMDALNTFIKMQNFCKRS